MQWQVALNNDSFDRAGITKDCQDAVCEYIWNSFEAGASKVTVSMMGSPLQEAMSLVVADNGMGIAFDNLDKTFGTFLSSLKNRLFARSNIATASRIVIILCFFMNSASFLMLLPFLNSEMKVVCYGYDYKTKRNSKRNNRRFASVFSEHKLIV